MSTGFSIAGSQDGGVSSSFMPSFVPSNNPLFIRAQINTTYQNVLLDTGSGITIIHHRFLKHIPHKNFKPIRHSFTSANCTTIHIIGQVLLEIKINNTCTLINAAVATNLVTDVLLGTDWIHKYVICIDISKQQLLIKDDRDCFTSTPFISDNNIFASPVLLSNHVTIPPYSEYFVTASVRISNNPSILFEPSYALQQKYIFMPNALLPVNNHEIQLKLFNITARPFTLPKNTRLGTINPTPITCTSSITRPSTQPLLHECYVCRTVFLSKNDLYRHLRAVCYPPELRQQIENLTTHINSLTDRTKIQEVLWRHGQLFDTRKPSKINLTIDHAIETGHHRPVYTPPYRRSIVDHQTLTNEVHKLLDQHIIEPSTSPWNSPVVLVRKKDGGTRFCVDYRKLNEITTKDSFPLPRIDDIFDQLSQSLYFTKLDFKNGYFQIPLAHHDRPKTAFSTRDDHYQFMVLPQGIKNGPPTFQRIINRILGPTRWKYCLAYLDDVIIFSKTFEDHLFHLNHVLQILAAYNFRLSVNKCAIATDNIDYLGHNIRNNELRPNHDNIRGLLQTPIPSTAKEIFRFLKAAEYYRKFIPKFSTIAAPLYKYNPSTTTQHNNTDRSKNFHLSSAEQAAFEQLKTILTTSLVLRLLDNHLPFKIQTDASQQGIDAVLLQTYPEGDRPVCYMSKKFTPTQQRWSPIEQECYAIVKAIEHWDHYLHGNKFILESGFW